MQPNIRFTPPHLKRLYNICSQDKIKFEIINIMRISNRTIVKVHKRYLGYIQSVYLRTSIDISMISFNMILTGTFTGPL